MLRISKLTDYGIVLLSRFARLRAGAQLSARELALATALPFPAVGKVLKLLAHGGLLVSHRGARGGYSLARPAGSISVAEIIEALEGPIALMECSAGPGHCEQEATCSVRDPWQRIHQAIQGTLANVTLASLVEREPLVHIGPLATEPAAAPGGAAGSGTHG
jgi:FeS assembly SUF system regulator